VNSSAPEGWQFLLHYWHSLLKLLIKINKQTWFNILAFLIFKLFRQRGMFVFPFIVMIYWTQHIHSFQNICISCLVSSYDIFIKIIQIKLSLALNYLSMVRNYTSCKLLYICKYVDMLFNWSISLPNVILKSEDTVLKAEDAVLKGRRYSTKGRRYSA
jgi:hypothetical protein